MKKVIKFYFIKLILVLTAAICASLVSYLISSTIGETKTELAKYIVTSSIPLLFFFWFTYTVGSKIRIPEDKTLDFSYFSGFALKEASVYALFLLPLVIASAFGADIAFGEGIISYLYRPHLALFYLTESQIINFIFDFIVYGIISAAAHFIKSKKSAKPKESIDADNGEN